MLRPPLHPAASTLCCSRTRNGLFSPIVALDYRSIPTMLLHVHPSRTPLGIGPTLATRTLKILDYIQTMSFPHHMALRRVRVLSYVTLSRWNGRPNWYCACIHKTIFNRCQTSNNPIMCAFSRIDTIPPLRHWMAGRICLSRRLYRIYLTPNLLVRMTSLHPPLGSGFQ